MPNSIVQLTPEGMRRAALMVSIHETCKEIAPEGAPEGPLYMAAMQKGYDLNDFTQIVGILVHKGFLRREGHVLYFERDLL